MNYICVGIILIILIKNIESSLSIALDSPNVIYIDSVMLCKLSLTFDSCEKAVTVSYWSNHGTTDEPSLFLKMDWPP